MKENESISMYLSYPLSSAKSYVGHGAAILILGII